MSGGATEGDATVSLADNGVTTAKIANAAVTAAKISSGNATNGQTLTANGSGGASWQTPSGGGGSSNQPPVVILGGPNISDENYFNDRFKGKNLTNALIEVTYTDTDSSDAIFDNATIYGQGISYNNFTNSSFKNATLNAGLNNNTFVSADFTGVTISDGRSLYSNDFTNSNFTRRPRPAPRPRNQGPRRLPPRPPRHHHPHRHRPDQRLRLPRRLTRPDPQSPAPAAERGPGRPPGTTAGLPARTQGDITLRRTSRQTHQHAPEARTSSSTWHWPRSGTSVRQGKTLRVIGPRAVRPILICVLWGCGPACGGRASPG